MRSRLAFSATLVLAAMIPLSAATAQDGGGRGFGGGGRNPGGLDMAIAPRFVDLTGPFAFDSVSALLSLDDAQKAKLDQIRADHLAKTKPMRDSLAVLAVEAGYTTPVPVAKPENPVPKEKAIKEYTKLINKLHQIDSDYYLKAVQPALNKAQWTSYKTWVQDKSVQRGRGGGMGGMGGMGRGGYDGGY